MGIDKTTTGALLKTLKSAAALAAGVFVKMGADDEHCVVAAAATDVIIGVTTHAVAAAEEDITIQMDKVALITLSGTIARGLRVTSAAAGKAATGIATNAQGGITLKSGAINDLVPMLISLGTM